MFLFLPSYPRRLFHMWHQQKARVVGQLGAKDLANKFVEWLQSRPQAWFPVHKSMAVKLCKKHCVTLKPQMSCDPKDSPPKKRSRSSNQSTAVTSSTTSPNPTVTWAESATPISASEDGKIEREWIDATLEEWRQRPEPQRSDALRELMHRLKVQDGQSMEYVTLFAWAGYQKQSQYITAIRQLVAARCVQEKVSEAKYRNDIVPHYKVMLCHVQECMHLC